MKMKRIGLNDCLALGGYGSDHLERAELVRIAVSRAGARFGFQPDGHVYLFGDTPRDVAAAKAAGVKSVAVATGRFGAEELRRCAPDFLLAGLSDTEAVRRDVIGM